MRYGLGFPRCLTTDHGVQTNEEHAHAGDDGDLGAFSASSKLLVAAFEVILFADHRESGHVEHTAYCRSPALDSALASVLAAVVVVGCQAHQRSDLLAIELAELG